jgi:hypothetical protein
MVSNKVLAESGTAQAYPSFTYAVVIRAESLQSDILACLR